MINGGDKPAGDLVIGIEDMVIEIGDKVTINIQTLTKGHLLSCSIIISCSVLSSCDSIVC